MPRLAVYISALKVGAIVAAAAAVACPPIVSRPTPSRGQEHQADGNGLPETAAECIELAERLGNEGASRAELRLALRALERAETLRGGELELWIEQARLIFLISEPISKQARVVPWLNRGQQLSKRVIRFAPSRVEGHYYYAAFIGFRAQLQEVGGLDLLPEIVEHGRRAIEIDETFNDAAPLMMMGMVLLKAPAWPHGVGDPEEGLEMLERGVELTDYPLNRLIYAKGLLIDGQRTAACKQLAKVLAAPKRGRWAKTGRRHRREAKVLSNTSRCSEIGREF